jgi:outer membrane protein assembly factor BamA
MFSRKRIIKLFAVSSLICATLTMAVFADTIQSIQVTGNKRIEAETVKSNLSLKVGDSFDDIQLWQWARR